MKNSAEYDQIPVFSICCEDVEEYHPNIEQDKSGKILLGLRNDESVFMLITQIRDVGNIVGPMLLVNSLTFG